LVFGLTSHVAKLAERGREVNNAVLLVSARFWASAVGEKGGNCLPPGADPVRPEGCREAVS